MGWVAGVFDNPPGFPCTPPGVDVLEGGKLTSNNVAGSSHNPLQSFAVAGGAVSKFHFLIHLTKTYRNTLLQTLEHGNIFYCSFRSCCKQEMFFISICVLFSSTNDERFLNKSCL